MYRIKYTYDTGDSFTNEEGLEGRLELGWEDLDVAKKNLERIEEHYRMYRDLERYVNRKTDAQILEDNSGKDWFVSEPRLVAYRVNPENYNAIDKKDVKKLKKMGYTVTNIFDRDSAKYHLVLYTDAGQPWKNRAPWCGYFESLVSAEIEVDMDLGLKKTFR